MYVTGSALVTPESIPPISRVNAGTDYQTEDLAFVCAERDADADLANSLLDTVREDSVESGSGT